MQRYIIGVDGGSTKTHICLFDLEGNSVDFLEIGSTNHETLKGSYKEVKDTLANAIFLLCSRKNIEMDSIVTSVFGLSGADTRLQHKMLVNELENIGLANIHVYNDAFLGVKAGSKESYGIGVVNGTGCTICGINEHGRMFKIGGQGEYTGEPGGGSFLGYSAIRAVYNQSFRNGTITLMTNMLFDIFSPTTKYEFIDDIREAVAAGKFKVGDLGVIVLKAADQGDAVAQEILKGMGAEIGISVNGVIRELAFPVEEVLKVILIGSINVKGANNTYLNVLKDVIRNENPARMIDYLILQKPAVAGAVIWALEEVHGDNHLYEKVLEQM